MASSILAPIGNPHSHSIFSVRSFNRLLFQITYVLFWLLGLCATTTRGQSADPLRDVGIPPFSAQLPVESGSINAASGNLHLEIPLGSFPQRGRPPRKFALVYDSTIWSDTGSSWVPNRTGQLGSLNLYGWRFNGNDVGHTKLSYSPVMYCTWSHPYYHGPKEAIYDSYSYTDGEGGIHLFDIQTREDTQTPCGPPPQSSIPDGNSMALDGSGYRMYVKSYSNITVYGPDGTVVYSDATTFATTGTDTNGNKNYNPLLTTDTLGRNPVTTSVSGNTITFQVLNSQGGTSTITATVEDLPVHTNFASAGSCLADYPAPINQNAPITVIKSISLPDGTSYQFGYDSGTTAGNYGQLTSMTLPTGAQITYSYANFVDSEFSYSCTNNTHISRGVSTRTTPDGAWNFTPAVIGPYQQQLTVTKPSYMGRQDNIVYKMTLDGGAWPTEVDYYTGAVSPANLAATLTQSFDLTHHCRNLTYPMSGNLCGSKPPSSTIASNVTKTATTIILPVPGGASLNQTTQYCYDNAGNLLHKWEWNFYTGAIVHDPNPPFTCSLYSGSIPDRTTNFTYQTFTYQPFPSLTQNILNRLATMTVADKNGNPVSQTVNSYDDWPLATSGATGIINHDDTNYGASNTVRGNLTQAKRWLNTTGSWLTTSNHYDIVGNLIQTTDSNLNNTYFDYTDNFYGVSPSPPTAAYVTKITKPVTNGVSHVGRIQHYFGSGLTSAKCGENFPTSVTCAFGISGPQPDYASYSYDSFERPSAINVGDGGQTSWSYSVQPSTASSTTKIDSSHNFYNTIILDGLGRVSQKQSSGGQGTIYVDSTYDSVGRPHTVSNPHLSTSSTTDGVTTNSSYDALDRVTLVTKQDGSMLTTSYTGNLQDGDRRGLEVAKVLL
jgi:hypothetical protein